MSLDIIIAKVLDDARAEAARILAEHRGKAEALLQGEARRAENQAEAVRREAEAEAALEAGRIVTQARLERRIELLAARKALVDEVLERAFAKGPLEHRALSKTIVSRDGETRRAVRPGEAPGRDPPGLENADRRDPEDMKRRSPLDYAYAVGRVRALETRLVGKAVFREAAGAPDLAVGAEDHLRGRPFPRRLRRRPDGRRRWTRRSKGRRPALDTLLARAPGRHRHPGDHRPGSPGRTRPSAWPKASEARSSRTTSGGRSTSGTSRSSCAPAVSGSRKKASRPWLLRGGFLEDGLFARCYAAPDAEIGAKLGSTPYAALWESAVRALAERETFVDLERGIEDLLMAGLRPAPHHGLRPGAGLRLRAGEAARARARPARGLRQDQRDSRPRSSRKGSATPMSDGMKVAIVGDAGLLFGFRALGIEVFSPASVDEARDVLARLEKEDYGLCLLHESFFGPLKEEREALGRKFSPVDRGLLGLQDGLGPPGGHAEGNGRPGHGLGRAGETEGMNMQQGKIVRVAGPARRRLRLLRRQDVRHGQDREPRPHRRDHRAQGGPGLHPGLRGHDRRRAGRAGRADRAGR